MWVPAPESPAWPIVLLAGALLGSPHCIAMCGPLRLLSPQTRRARISYQAGRGAAYALLGAAAGLLGWSLSPAALVFLVPVILVVSYIGVRPPSGWAVFRSRILSAASAHPAGMGFASGLLPCGLLHGWLAVAAAAQSPLRGALVLFALWLGTLPALEVGTWAMAKPVSKLRRRYPRLTFALVALTALAPIFWREHLSLAKSPARSCHGGAAPAITSPPARSARP